MKHLQFLRVLELDGPTTVLYVDRISNKPQALKMPVTLEAGLYVIDFDIKGENDPVFRPINADYSTRQT